MRVGQNLVYSVGILRYPKSSAAVATVVAAVIIPVIVLLAVITLLIAMYIFIYRRRSSVTLRYVISRMVIVSEHE